MKKISPNALIIALLVDSLFGAASCGDKVATSSTYRKQEIQRSDAAQTAQPMPDAAPPPVSAVKTEVLQSNEKALPELKFISPSDSGGAAADSYVIRVVLTNAAPTATWAVYYSNTEGAIIGGLPIAENISSGQTAVTWDTSIIELGNYYLYAVLGENSDVYKFPAKGMVKITRTPIVTLTSHQGNQIFKNQTGPGTVIWTTINSRAGLHYTLAYSADNGITYQTIPGAEDLDGVYSFSGWDISNSKTYVQGARYKIRVSAIDKSTSEPQVISTSESPEAFGIAEKNTDLTYYQAVYLSLQRQGCSACHGNGKPNVKSFALDEYDLPFVGAFKRQSRLASDAILGASGTMRAKAKGFTDSDFDLIKLWKWNGASKGVRSSVVFTSPLENQFFKSTAGNIPVAWSITGAPPGITYTLSYLPRGGNPVSIQTALIGTSYNMWNGTGLIEGFYSLRLEAVDATAQVLAQADSAEIYLSPDGPTYQYGVQPLLLSLGCGGCHGGQGGYTVANGVSGLQAAQNLVDRTGPTGNMPQNMTTTGIGAADFKLIDEWRISGFKN